MDLMGILAMDADEAKARGFGALFEELRRKEKKAARLEPRAGTLKTAVGAASRRDT
jgi:hypothetical protein